MGTFGRAVRVPGAAHGPAGAVGSGSPSDKLACTWPWTACVAIKEQTGCPESCRPSSPAPFRWVTRQWAQPTDRPGSETSRTRGERPREAACALWPTGAPVHSVWGWHADAGRARLGPEGRAQPAARVPVGVLVSGHDLALQWDHPLAPCGMPSPRVRCQGRGLPCDISTVSQVSQAGRRGLCAQSEHPRTCPGLLVPAVPPC